MFPVAFFKSSFFFSVLSGIVIVLLNLLTGLGMKPSVLFAGAALICSGVVMFVPALIIGGAFKDVSRQLNFVGLVLLVIYLALNMS